MNLQGKGHHNAVDLTPMIDVVFQLIIFFMLSSHLNDLKRSKIDLPEQKGQCEQQSVEAAMIIDIDASGQYLLDGGSEAVDEGLVVKSKKRRILERATFAGLGISVLIHLVMMLIAFLVRVDFGDAGGGGGGDAPIEFAVLSAADLDDAPAAAEEEVELEAIETEIVTEMELETDLGSEISFQDLGDTLAADLVAGGASSVQVSGISGVSGESGGASFFGLEASGKRFAYIVDQSGSMGTQLDSGEQTRWELTQHEVIRSVRGLKPSAEYFIVLYSNGATPLFGNQSWLRRSKANYASTSVAVMNQDPGGGTFPTRAFEIVFQLSPRPDAIYFMTDGEFNDSVPGSIASMNRQSEIPIHCILLGDPLGGGNHRKVEGMLKKIARDSGGQYQHVTDSPGRRGELVP